MTIDADVLREMIAEDELGLLTLPVKSEGMTKDGRLIASFAEITEFARREGRAPNQESGDIGEIKLAMRLDAMSASDEQREALTPHDELGLLKPPTPPESIEEALADDSLGLLDDQAGIFELRNVPKPSEVTSDPARRKPCKDFDQFEPLFKECQRELRAGIRKLLPFRDEQAISAKHFYVLNGVLVYVAAEAEREIMHGRRNARLRCIFENGTEADLLLRSFASRLYRFGKTVTEPETDTLHAVEQQLSGKEPGFVYVMRSLSDDPQVKGIPDLHKIGSTSRSPEDRAGEAQASTAFLGAPVRLVASFEMSRGVARKVERLLHRFLAPARLDIWFERTGTTVAEANEWFAVPLAAVEETVDLIEAGTIDNYEYDVDSGSVRLRAS